ncbi:hypothetical protein MBANPS3_011731, partial [Mucor bainieri]
MYVKQERSTPCIACRNLRRKCIRPNNLDAGCRRCEKRGEICQLGDEDKDLKALKSQVRQLEEAVAQMEEQLQIRHGYDSSNSYSTCDGTLARNQRHYSSSELSIQMIQGLYHTWKVKIENGTFHIETGIQNISDLLHFHPFITYLSPLSQHCTTVSSAAGSWSSNRSNHGDNSSDNFIMRFGGEGTARLTPCTINICMKAMLTHSPAASTWTMPNAWLLGPRAFVDQLLSIYFNCQNRHKPMVHEPTHRAKLATIEDPLTDLVTLSICCYVCSASCRHLQLPLQERRTMADYFHAKALGIIMDQFDQPEKRLETVMGINLLIEYMHMTFKFEECRKLLSMAIQILLDLRNDYPEFRATGTKTCFEGGPHSGHYTFTKDEGPVTDVDKMLFTRHVAISLWLNVLLEHMGVNVGDDECFHFPVWEYVVDEPEETKRFVRAQNWVINLYNHPFLTIFGRQLFRVNVGDTGALGFESIVLLESVLQEWTMALPAEFRLCRDLYDKRTCFEAIDLTNDTVVLTTFILFHIFHVDTYSCLLQPKSLADETQQQLLSCVQDRSLHKLLTSCQLALYGIHRLAMVESRSCSYKLGASEFLLNVLDALGLLVLSTNMHIAKAARPIMKSCLNELDANRLAIRFQVQPDYSQCRAVLNVPELMNG